MSDPSPATKPPHHRRRILWLLLAAVVGLVALTLIINVVQRELRGPKDQPNPIVLTARQLDQLQLLIQQYVDEHRRSPGQTLEEALQTLADSGVDFDSPDWRSVADGRDTWEHPFIYVPTEQGTLIVRSIGSNGRHEHGGGDDIQRIIKLSP
ncbi:type II secretion system protein GspG [Blastopirellula marina]|uniref:Type II secretion system protein GspG C-terminal domain-containing protein n=1 Tax=Blastopirellula marina TaxID=124 RepID=A0A2S8GGU6_9BACT|nr:type II secretion system protein GspG [Blastopirellula marina]PQO43530.1 hypothetical protein C5Y93_23040 [Blastopirellula marina]